MFKKNWNKIVNNIFINNQKLGKDTFLTNNFINFYKIRSIYKRSNPFWNRTKIGGKWLAITFYDRSDLSINYNMYPDVYVTKEKIIFKDLKFNIQTCIVYKDLEDFRLEKLKNI